LFNHFDADDEVLFSMSDVQGNAFAKIVRKNSYYSGYYYQLYYKNPVLDEWNSYDSDYLEFIKSSTVYVFGN
jgi:hypothetical protein